MSYQHSEDQCPKSSSPTPSTASPKPVRRRSRASKKTPTTLLNADASNFRDLVQQFTGRASSLSVNPPGSQRGPVNINFGEGGSGSGFNHIGSFGAGYTDQSQFSYDQQSYGYASGNLNSGSFVGDGMNVDDLDWEAISASTSHGDDGRHFM